MAKKECYKTIKAKTNATLKVDEDKTVPDGENVFIEGDNLEVLKLLQNAYHKKVKMIYIDPPYNKDKDFVYKDTWGDTITNYMIQTDQLREEGYTSTKTNSTGRRHTNWLNMIYPRLWLSRNLLKDDGVIFVSIDDDEVHNLRKVMDEIYGEDNFIAQIVWKSKLGKIGTTSTISTTHEYILIYAKKYEYLSFKMIEKFNKDRKENLRQWGQADRREDRPSMYYPIIIDGITVYPMRTNGTDGRWRVGEETAKELLKEGLLELVENDGNYSVYRTFPDGISKIPFDTLLTDIGTTAQGTLILKELGLQNYFDYPKPVNLIKHFLNLSTNKNDIILDFFAGSGTTAHAVMDLNKEDKKNGKIGNRKYILVQLPEATDEKSEAYKAGYKKISDITKERIKRVIKKLDYKDGFKSFYLDNSNFQMFKELKKRPNDSLEDIEKMLKMSIFNENILTQGAKELDLVYEVGLKNGFTLSAKTQTLQSGIYNFTKLYEDEREFFFCFDKEIANDIVNAVPKEAKLICYEKALGDSVKLNLHSNLDLETL